MSLIVEIKMNKGKKTIFIIFALLLSYLCTAVVMALSIPEIGYGYISLFDFLLYPFRIQRYLKETSTSYYIDMIEFLVLLLIPMLLVVYKGFVFSDTKGTSVLSAPFIGIAISMIIVLIADIFFPLILFVYKLGRFMHGFLLSIVSFFLFCVSYREKQYYSKCWTTDRMRRFTSFQILYTVVFIVGIFLMTSYNVLLTIIILVFVIIRFLND